MTYQQAKLMMIISIFILSFSFITLNAYIIYGCLGIILILGIIYLKIYKIKETTLCLIVKNDKVLMMLRNKKKNDVHINKYNGLGGKVEFGESKEKCVKREVFEEAGVILTDYHYVGKVIFKNFGNQIGKEIMYCYVAYDFKNELIECNEGELEWVNKSDVLSLPLWEGDQYFLMNIINNEPFNGYLHYDLDKVVNHKIKRR